MGKRLGLAAVVRSGYWVHPTALRDRKAKGDCHGLSCALMFSRKCLGQRWHALSKGRQKLLLKG
jgi:hypothetical protein